MRNQLLAMAIFSCANLTVLLAGQEMFNPKVLGPSNEGINALKRITVPKGTVATLVAAEPMVANPIAFCFDEKGSIYVAETFRVYAGASDNKKHMFKVKSWLDEELACQTVEDRMAMYKKHLSKELKIWGKNPDRIRKLVDTEGTGKVDKAYVFAEGFNTPVSGLGAGVLARQGKVWYSCIPDLWLMEDTKGVHKADVQKSLLYGFGVHTCYAGHDLHGLKMGPDGRLYFSSGDRGFNVKTEGRVVANPHSGAVLRCNPDGSELEIVHIGMRNPQEIAFDAYGNLFTGDNNAEKGDRARWVHIVEGGDSGWRLGFQEMNKPTALGMWNMEKIWQLPHEGQNANIVPPVNHIATGPSGVTYHPGITQIPERYKNHFFLCDFKGFAQNSGIYAFKLKPRGASFDFDGQPEQFVWSVLATDCDFGPDGGFYLTDWVNGFDLTGKGRIYKVGDPSKAKDAAVLEVKKLIAEGMSKRPTAELVKLLEHADMRIRQEAQFALVDRNAAAELTKAISNANKLARLHGIWGLGMLQRKDPDDSLKVLAALPPLLTDKDLDVRCQALKVLGEARHVGQLANIVKQLKADEPRVRFFAAQALARLGKAEAVPAVADMLRENADKDPYLRHAGVMALVGTNNRQAISSIAKDPSPAVRLASLLAMRRLGMVEVTQFLNDANPNIVVEAARAIYDQPINEAMPQLAAMITRTGMSTPLLYRVVNANFRIKQKENAEALARFASRADVPEALRIEAMDCLRSWDEQVNRDRLVGLSRPVAPRPASEAADALRANLGVIFSGSNKVRAEAAKVASKFGIKEVGPALRQIANDAKRPAEVRVESLKALAVLKDAELTAVMKVAMADSDARVRTEGRRIMAQLDPKAAVDELKKALDSGDTVDRQGAFAILGPMPVPAAGMLLETWLDKLLAKQVPAEIQLDLLEAAGKHKAKSILTKLAKFESSRPATDHLSKWSETLYGGNADNGKRIFLERSELSCLRCHKVQGNGGDVGPDLTGIGGKQKREYLLEAIVLPDKQIAQGYETVLLTLRDGKVKSGILKSEDKKEVRLMTPEGAIMVVPVADIDTRTRGPSAMPADLNRYLSARDLRDLVEYLAGLK